MEEIIYKPVIVRGKGNDFTEVTIPMKDTILKNVIHVHVYGPDIYCFEDEKVMEKWLKQWVPNVNYYKKVSAWKFYQRAEKQNEAYKAIDKDTQEWINDLQNRLIKFKSSKTLHSVRNYEGTNSELRSIREELEKEGLLNSVTIFCRQSCKTYVPEDYKTLEGPMQINNLDTLQPPPPNQPDDKTPQNSWRNKIRSLEVTTGGFIRMWPNIDFRPPPPPPPWDFWGPCQYLTLPLPMNQNAESLTTQEV